MLKCVIINLFIENLDNLLADVNMLEISKLYDFTFKFLKKFNFFTIKVIL